MLPDCIPQVPSAYSLLPLCAAMTWRAATVLQTLGSVPVCLRQATSAGDMQLLGHFGSSIVVSTKVLAVV